MRYIQASGSTFSRHIIDNGDPVVFGENHNTRASKLTPEEATAFGVHKLKLVTPPPYNPLTQTRTDADAALVDGVWTQVWQVRDLSNEEILQRNTTQSAVVRSIRNAKLTESDWTQGADTPQAIKDKYAPYRQALRDVPAQAGFPNTIVWPTQPE
jgi:hypothetical protein